jgi:hypothetical protein
MRDHAAMAVVRSAGPRPFLVRDCALIALATGRKANHLPEFRRDLAEVDASSIYHHFWGGLLQPRFEEREYNNDFAAWVRHGIHDGVLAERLAALDPAPFTDMEALRQELLEQVDARLDEAEYLSWTRATQQFEFLSSQIVVLNTGRELHAPRDLLRAVPEMSTGSIFYHFIDARRRTADGSDDFSGWLGALGDRCASLCAALQGVDPYFGSLTDLRARLVRVLTEHMGDPPG